MILWLAIWAGSKQRLLAACWADPGQNSRLAQLGARGMADLEDLTIKLQGTNCYYVLFRKVRKSHSEKPPPSAAGGPSYIASVAVCLARLRQKIVERDGTAAKLLALCCEGRNINQANFLSALPTSIYFANGNALRNRVPALPSKLPPVFYLDGNILARVVRHAFPLSGSALQFDSSLFEFGSLRFLVLFAAFGQMLQARVLRQIFQLASHARNVLVELVSETDHLCQITRPLKLCQLGIIAFRRCSMRSIP